jgi:nitrogen-specific signal transduction histidine kinase
MLVNQSDPESMMPKEEARAAFTGPVNSALLVPLISDQKTVGLLSLVEERDWNRRPFTSPEILTAELAADRLAELVCHLLQNNPEEWPKPVQPDQLQINSVALRRQLSDPLCGILGASELILAKGDGLDDNSLRYAQIIHRMAERIRDWVQCES